MLEPDPRAGRSARRAAGIATLLLVMTLSSGGAGVLGCASDGPDDAAQTSAAEESPEEGRLEPRYEPREPEPKPFYNTKLLFGMTRAVVNSTIHPGAQVPLVVLTIPFDIVFLPFAAIGGFF